MNPGNFFVFHFRAIISLCVGFVFVCGLIKGENACTFQLSRGGSLIQRQGKLTWETVGTQKTPIFIGDKIKSEAETRGELSFPDGSLFRLKSNTILVLLNEGVQLKVGETWFNLQKQGRNFQIVTPSSVCGVVGTTFDVSVNPRGGTIVRVFDGMVRVRNNFDKSKRMLELRRGQTVETNLSSSLPDRPKTFQIESILKANPDLMPIKPPLPGHNPRFPQGAPGLQGAPKPVPPVQHPGALNRFQGSRQKELKPGSKKQPGHEPDSRNQINLRDQLRQGFQNGSQLNSAAREKLEKAIEKNSVNSSNSPNNSTSPGTQNPSHGNSPGTTSGVQLGTQTKTHSTAKETIQNFRNH